MKRFFPFVFAFLPLISLAQSVSQKLQKAFQQFESDSQLKHAISSLYVIDAKTGQVVFGKNSQVGLVPASTQKIITSVTAFELLGKDYQYKTEFNIDNATMKNVSIIPSSDPTFGSTRFESTTEKEILKNIFTAFTTKLRDRKIENLGINDELNEIPDGWIWQDIGNYYGAASSNLNWKENQYDLVFKSGKTSYKTDIIEISPKIPNVMFNNQVVAGTPNSGDNAYIYFGKSNDTILVKGTVPPDKNNFSISGSMPDPAGVFLNTISTYFSDIKRNFPIDIKKITRIPYFVKTPDMLSGVMGYKNTIETIYTHYSPSLDSIIYWFLKKSINLYGEALIKTFAYEKQGFGSTDSGVALVKKFWKTKGLDEDELNLHDGSGLSPLNRVTTHVQVEILKYAKKKDWFPYFYDALPEYNGMKMKSGTISDVKGFCGYHKAKDGKEYIFSFLVNNYNGKTSGVVNKMYKVLDELK